MLEWCDADVDRPEGSSRDPAGAKQVSCSVSHSFILNSIFIYNVYIQESCFLPSPKKVNTRAVITRWIFFSFF